jgi:hypothetical protein
MRFTIFRKETGQITGVVSCPESDLSIQFDPVTHDFLPEAIRDDLFYISNREPIEFPVQPSESHIFNWQTKQWEDPRTLQDLKDEQWGAIKQARSQAEYAGFTWDGSTFDSDAISQNRITGAVTLAMLSPAFTIDWVLADNTTRLLDQEGMAQVGGALGAHVAAQFAKGVMLRAQIEAATSQAEVEAVTW